MGDRDLAPVTSRSVRRPKGNEEAREPVSPEIVERCRRGDEEAWAQLVEATHREVYTLCLRILRDPNDAAEATQDAYLRAWRGLRSFRGDAAFGTWLYRVASNAALSKHRSRKRKSGLDSGYEDDALERIPSPRSTEDAATARIEVAELEKALGDLPEHYRAAVVLRDIYGMSTEEIAKELGVSTTAAKVRVHRGRKMLRVAMFPPEESEDAE